MDGSLEGKVALVTGGSSGIGRATAQLFAKKGARVVIQDIDIEKGNDAVQSIVKEGGESYFVRGDVTSKADVKNVISETVDRYGSLDCVMNNAATLRGLNTKIHEYEEETWDHYMDILLKAVWLGMKYQITQMLKQGGGTIVNTSSIAGLAARSGSCAYVAAKHGVIGLTKTAALEYAKDGIRINAVCPAQIHTPRMDKIIELDPGFLEREIPTMPLGRVGQPIEIAEATIWLCSDESSFVTGHALAVDGGYLAQ